MSFDDSNVMIRSEEETKRLKEERRKRMFGGAPSPVQFQQMCPPWTHLLKLPG